MQATKMVQPHNSFPLINVQQYPDIMTSFFGLLSHCNIIEFQRALLQAFFRFSKRVYFIAFQRLKKKAFNIDIYGPSYYTGITTAKHISGCMG